MEIVKIKHIYDFISFIPLLLFFYSFIQIFINNNTILFVGCVLVSFIQKILKKLTQDIFPKLFKRPDESEDTNILNSGGFSGNKSGFPSGHTFTTSFVLFYLSFFQDQSFFSLNSFYKQAIIIMVAYARVKKKAHNIFQVVFGYFFGMILAYYLVKF